MKSKRFLRIALMGVAIFSIMAIGVVSTVNAEKGHITLTDRGDLIHLGDAVYYGSVYVYMPPGTKAMDVEYTPTRRGHITLLDDGDMVFLGDAVSYGNSKPLMPGGGVKAVDVEYTKTGNGYIVLLDRGDIVYGFGDGALLAAELSWVNPFSCCMLPGMKAVDMEITPTGKGIVVLTDRGDIIHLGDAVYYGNPYSIYGQYVPTAKAVAIEVTPTGQGYLVLFDNGTVIFLGDGINFPPYAPYVYMPPGTKSIDVKYTPTGNGYIVLLDRGDIIHFGDAVYYGNPVGYMPGGGVKAVDVEFTPMPPPNTAPVAMCQDIQVALDMNGQATITANGVNNGSFDPNGDTITLSIDRSAFDCNDVGSVNDVTLTVSDGTLTAFCAAQVTVEDNIVPTVYCPNNITVNNDLGFCDAVVDFDVTAADNCGIDSIVMNPASGSVFPVGTTTVNVTATDTSGNTATCSFTVTVIDNTAPTITSFSVSPSIVWPPNHEMVTITPTLVALDNCNALVTYSVTSNEAVNGLGDGDTATDWTVNGSNIQIRAERSGKGSGRVYTITATVTDSSGNSSSSAPATVTVPHDKRK